MPINTLVLNSVTKTFDEFKALDNLNLTVPQGCVFGLIGPNGAGKTTTINCIADLIHIDAGQIAIFGRSLQSDGILVKKKMGILHENVDELFVYLKGQEHLEFVGQIYGLSKATMFQRIDDLFDFFEMASHRYILIDDYSKGMKKKIALASILLHDPEFIILDEPFEGLDTITMVKVKNLLKKLKANGKTVLLTSHILAFIEDLCDYIAIIHQGKIVYENNTDKIRSEVTKKISKNSEFSGLEELLLNIVENENDHEKRLDWI